MSACRDRGTPHITTEERSRRVREAKNNIRKTATYTPPLLGLIESRIESNAFRRCMSDNSIYQSICNSLKDKNIPERERHPDIVDFLALEAILPVNYDGEYNRVLKDLLLRCDTEAWVDEAVLQENHKCFWHEILKDHPLYDPIMDKVAKCQNLTQRDVITAVAINGGKYPTEIFRHLVVYQNSNMLNWGSNIGARNALYDDEVFQCVRADTTIYSETMVNLEFFEKAMQNKHKSCEVRKKINEMKELMKDDIGILRHIQGGRVQKIASGNNALRNPTGDESIHSRRNFAAFSNPDLSATQELGGY
ncbi:hypothetical protein LY78DRAFT_704375 [Colletotrichum sublineola]|nr:hypothetical protein LY78DRAFT_704375 [Colletotrichum sublineola]